MILDRLARIQLTIFAIVTVLTVTSIALFYLHLPAKVGLGVYTISADFAAGSVSAPSACSSAGSCAGSGASWQRELPATPGQSLRLPVRLAGMARLQVVLANQRGREVWQSPQYALMVLPE